MENTVDVTVIIPMYNAAKFIEKTVASILVQQPHQLSLEIIIIDDASTDHSCEIVQRINSDKIKLVQLSKNGGSSNARNTGIGLAQGTWIQFVDSDDMVCHDLYKKFEAVIVPEFNCYLFSMISEFHQFTIKQTIAKVADKRAFGHFGSVCNKFIKREICIAFDSEILQHEDMLYAINMMSENRLKIALIEDAYYLYNRKNENSKTAKFATEKFNKMYASVYKQIDKCDDVTKLFILEIFGALPLDRKRPFMMSLSIAIKTLFKLYSYLPKLILNQNRHNLIRTKIQHSN